MKAKNYISEKLTALMAAKGQALPAKTTIEAPKSEQHGDMATNITMVMPKEKGQNPRTVAEALKTELLAMCPEIESIEIAGPGFINFTFKPVFWQEVALAALENKADFGRIDVGQGRKVQVEYVSANPTGPLHIGHGRGAAVGDSLTRILRFTGHEVETEYYLNDAGRQMRLLGLAVWVRYQQACGIEIPFPEDCYRGDYIKDISAALLAEKGKALLDLPEEEALDLCYERGMTDILNGIKQDLIDFRVEHQHWFSEKSLVDGGQVEASLNRLLAEGRAYEKDGALWFRSTDHGDDKDRVLRKSDGLLTYFASDIAYHDNKIARGFDMMVDIWGADHHGYVPRMKAAIEALGKDRESLQVILVQLVNLIQGGEQIAMSTRAGKFETLADVCAEVGVDAARFIFLSRKSDSHLDFDLDVVKQQSMDNPVYYVQYAHARISSLMRKAEEQGVALPEPSGALMALLTTPEDKALFKALDAFEDTLELAARTLSPHHVSYYLMELAGLLHRYYTVHHILSGDDQALLQARILLFQAVAGVLKAGLDLLGVNAPERM
ncbi:arginine--tRNA ligase [Desulfomicrobium baculatum]|uniref:Arginine--tRNA ligase n=1 Tax=Desulfomicrobium baculatum (strain DSM 4028 / VKM B-1378 / X) TaxID=525897 RepID=C7LUG5_DESBD|nr:arginine--tRNA ligase [Desulfomicrobium baculatum]ACU89700.1 arginyl-tRNA synthetase [Desulfomicrobium baculatum DSM 4028]